MRCFIASSHSLSRSASNTRFGILRHREPAAECQFAFELARSPTGVAERDETLSGASMVTDVAQHLGIGCHRHAAIDIDGAGTMVVGTVHDEAGLRLHRPAGEQAHAALAALAVEPERIQQFRHRQLPGRTVDGDPQRAVLVVPHHQDDRVAEARIAHLGRGDQKLAGERCAWPRVLRLRQRDVGQHRRDQQDAEPQHDTPGPHGRHRPASCRDAPAGANR